MSSDDASTPETPAALFPRLPRGPHRLSRETVEESQRNRILLAAVEVMAGKGYATTSVSDIVARAGVSRATFYQLFEDRLDCFLAANAIAQTILMAALDDQLKELESEAQSEPAERVSALLTTYLSTLADNAAFARVFLIEVYAAGPKAIEQRRQAYEKFVDLFSAAQSPNAGAGHGATAEERMMTEVLVAAVSSFVTNAVGADDVESLSELHTPIMAAVNRLIETRS